MKAVSPMRGGGSVAFTLLGEQDLVTLGEGGRED